MLRNLVIIVLLFISLKSVSQERYAVIDTQRSVMESEEGINAQMKLAKMFDSKSRAIDKMKEDLDSKIKVFEAKQLKMDETETQESLDELVILSSQVEFRVSQFERERKRAQSELQGPIYTKVNLAVKRIAFMNGYKAVFEKKTVPYHQADLDITDLVITMLNWEQTPTNNSNPMPSAAPKRP